MFVLDMKTGEILSGPQERRTEAHRAPSPPAHEAPMPALAPIGQDARIRRGRHTLPEGLLADALLDSLPE